MAYGGAAILYCKTDCGVIANCGRALPWADLGARCFSSSVSLPIFLYSLSFHYISLYTWADFSGWGLTWVLAARALLRYIDAIKTLPMPLFDTSEQLTRHEYFLRSNSFIVWLVCLIMSMFDNLSSITTYQPSFTFSDTFGKVKYGV